MQRFSKVAAEDHLKRVFRLICKYADSQFSKDVLERVESQGFKGLTDVTLDPASYDNSYVFSKDYLVYNFGRKLESLDGSNHCKVAAFRSFITAELLCQKTNERFRGPRPYSDQEGYLSVAKDLIGRVLGSVPTSTKTEGCRFGPGATFTLSGEKSTWDHKIREDRISVTADAYRRAVTLFSCDPHLFEARHGVLPEGEFSLVGHEFRIIPGCKLITVPKTFKTDRCICVEPSANVMLQKGAGSIIRRSLKRYGVDLNSQTKNQQMAAAAYKSGYSTIDLESASDTVSTGLVMDLLPLPWFLYLDSLRSKSFMFEDRWYDLEKFSAMGNGFTFELESLIFWALACSVVPVTQHHEISVFGDDIIVPREYAPAVLELLTYCGFLPNKQKTFIDGKFFESCGKHYFEGFDVTPIYQKVYPNDESEIYRLANRLYRFSCRQYGSGPDSIGCSKALRRTWLFAWSIVEVPLLIPVSDSDVGVISVHGKIVSVKGRSYIRGLLPYPRRIPVGDSQALAYTLRFQPEEPVTGLLSLRSRPRYRYGMRRVWTQF